MKSMKLKFAWGLVLLLVAGLPVAHSAPTGRQSGVLRRVNAPYFDGEVRFAEMAIFWFGHVTPTENHVDVRVGYNDDYLYLRLAAFDRRLWYDRTPSAQDLTAWDAATLYLHLDGDVGSVPDANAYRFQAQMVSWEPRQDYQAVYRGDGTGWVTATVPYTTTSGWRGNAPNDDADDRGWALSYYLPFASLGLDGPPAPGAVWGMALELHDRDDATGTPIADKVWPETMNAQQPATWGQLAFGMPTHSPPPAMPVETITVRQELDGALVPDADVGGGSTCGSGLDFWSEWGEANYAGETDLNIQNQFDVADWPCFSKYYVTFPLDAMPPDKVIISATLTLYQFGNAGGGQWGDPYPSLIQVLAIAEDWDEATLTWNNAPLAAQNISSAWVDPLSSFPGHPGVPREWDVSQAVAEAYTAGEPVRLALYSADSARHSGKYFVSSDTGEWNAEGRPTLRVLWGEPLATVHKAVWPVAARRGQIVTYTLSLLGSSQELTLTDRLPAQVSAPGPIQVTQGEPEAAYDVGTHRLTWSGAPSVGQPLTITFPVTVQVTGPLAVPNTAVLTVAGGRVTSHSATFIVDARQVWLPLALRNR
jgi:hypothetical protein